MTLMTAGGSLGVVAHAVHYGIIVFGLVGVVLLLLPQRLHRSRATRVLAPRDEHEQRVRELRDSLAGMDGVAGAGTVTTPDRPAGTRGTTLGDPAPARRGQQRRRCGGARRHGPAALLRGFSARPLLRALRDRAAGVGLPGAHLRRCPSPARRRAPQPRVRAPVGDHPHPRPAFRVDPRARGGGRLGRRHRRLGAGRDGLLPGSRYAVRRPPAPRGGRPGPARLGCGWSSPSSFSPCCPSPRVGHELPRRPREESRP